MSSAHIPGQPEPDRAAAGFVDGLDASADLSHSAPQPPTKTDSPKETPQPKVAPIQAKQSRSRIVKRYSNRKLYDTTRSKYVTLDEIARMVRNGEDVRIIDNESKEDLTSVTLTQIIYEQEKAARRMPLGILRGIIQTRGGTLNDWLESITPPQRPVSASVSEIKQGATTIRDKASKQLNGLKDTARRLFSGQERQAEEFKQTIRLHLEHLETSLTARADEVSATRTAMEQQELLDDDQGPYPSADEVREQNTFTLSLVSEIRTRISALSVLIDRLEQAAGGPKSGD
ncbi:MAG: polyhydroxyalkanoate synthesis regulator DNA-binding domain-containing protein [Myxococcales bacterium]|nr:polyhydroxyalkanoate synthesis regulator DNA-binding domain-containing protein [Myxococcales bacterium]